MRIYIVYACAIAIAASLPVSRLQASDGDANAEKIARLEARLSELEARLAETEQETQEVKVLAASGSVVSDSQIPGHSAAIDVLANNAWRKLRWTNEKQWEGIQRGVSQEEVVELLGSPPRSVESLKPRVDEVYYYETSLRDISSTLRGKVSFKDGKVVAVKKPNFQSLKTAQ